MQVVERSGYSREEILDVLHAKNNARNVRFRYDLLDKNEYYKKTLNSVVSGEVAMSAFSTIKRTAKFRVKENYVPEYVGTEPLQSTEIGNLTAEWSQWTYTNLQMRADGEGIQFPAHTQHADFKFETPWDGSGGFTPWREWNASTTLEQVTGVVGSYAQQITRASVPAGSPWGIATDVNTYLTSLVSGEKVYLSFYYKIVSGALSTPTYTYLLASAGGNISLGSSSVYTVTDVGGGWNRVDAEFTIPSANAGASCGILIATSGGSTTTDKFIVDNVYLGRVKPKWEGEAVSPIFDMSVIDTQAIQQLVTGSLIDYTDYYTNYNSASGVNAPTLKYYSRVSSDGGTTWSAWSLLTDLGEFPDITLGADLAGIQVQLKVTATRHDPTDASLVTGYYRFDINYDKYYIVPESTEINYLSDRIQPIMEIQMGDGKWISFPLGVFILSTPTRKDEVSGVYRDIEAYDGLIVLDEDKFTSRYFIAGGTKYTTAIEGILTTAGITKFNIKDSDKLISSAGIEFKVGSSKLEAINSLLSALNYTPLWVDAIGYYTASPYVSPTERAVDYGYYDDELSVTYNGMEEELDLFNIPNSWVVTQSNPEKTPLVAKKVNSDPKSQTSTVSIGRSIVDFREVDDIADQTTLNAYVERIAFESSQVFGKLKFTTALMPFHEYSDILHVKYDALKIDDKFNETGWTMQLEAGGTMTHEVRKVVSV